MSASVLQRPKTMWRMQAYVALQVGSCRTSSTCCAVALCCCNSTGHQATLAATSSTPLKPDQSCMSCSPPIMSCSRPTLWSATMQTSLNLAHTASTDPALPINPMDWHNNNNNKILWHIISISYSTYNCFHAHTRPHRVGQLHTRTTVTMNTHRPTRPQSGRHTARKNLARISPVDEIFFFKSEVLGHKAVVRAEAGSAVQAAAERKHLNIGQGVLAYGFNIDSPSWARVAQARPERSGQAQWHGTCAP